LYEWDYVILQEQSVKPALPPEIVATDVYPYAEILCQMIVDYNLSASPIFYMTWGRENGLESYCDYYPPFCTYEGMQQRLVESYTEMAENNNSLLAPVGLAWQSLRETNPEINLYNPDGSHPSIEGSYLAACVFYSIIFNDTPNNTFVPFGLNLSTAEIIQECVSTITSPINLSILSTDQEAPIKLIKMIDVLGREQHEHNKESLLFYIYDNGMVERILKH